MVQIVMQTTIHHLTGNEYLNAIQAALQSRAPLTTACDAYSVMVHADRTHGEGSEQSEWATAEFHRLGGHAGMRAEKGQK